MKMPNPSAETRLSQAIARLNDSSIYQRPPKPPIAIINLLTRNGCVVYYPLEINWAFSRRLPPSVRRWPPEWRRQVPLGRPIPTLGTRISFTKLSKSISPFLHHSFCLLFLFLWRQQSMVARAIYVRVYHIYHGVPGAIAIFLFSPDYPYGESVIMGRWISTKYCFFRLISKITFENTPK